MAMSRPSATILLAAAVAGALGTPAAANVGVSVFARAATICTVEVAGNYAQALAAGETSLGQMTELCNNVEGYRLILNHPAGMQDAWIVMDGQRVQLSSSSRTVIVDSNAPAFRQRNIGIVLASNMQGLPLSLEAQPKGMIF